VGVLRSIGSALVTVLGAVGTVILFVIVLLALPLFVAGVLVDYMMFRPQREHEVLARLRSIEAELVDYRPR
jgi:hypothetical protein